MQEDNPGAGFWSVLVSPSASFVFMRGSGPENIWLPVGFGAF